MPKSRKNYSAQAKVAILRESLLGNVPVSDVCEKHGLHPTLFYRWQKQFFDNGALAFERQDGRQEARQERKIGELEAKVQRKNEVLSELMEEHVALKKTLGGI